MLFKVIGSSNEISLTFRTELEIGVDVKFNPETEIFLNSPSQSCETYKNHTESDH